MIGHIDIAATGLHLLDTVHVNPYANRDGNHPAPPPRARVLHLAAAIERPHQQRDRPHDDGLDIPEQIAERGPEIDERGLRWRVHDADSLRRPATRRDSSL